MNYKLSQSKRMQAVIVLAVAALLVLTGTFAWYSFNQSRINTFNIVSAPNVNLHDDFAGGPQKDVYVENSGDQPALVRVRLTELLILNGALLPEGAVDDETAKDWHVHTPSENGCEVCEFKAHEYFEWTMSGHKFYMPAAASAKGFEIEDTYTEPKAVGDLDAIIDYIALLQNAFADNQTALDYMAEYLSGDTTNADQLQEEISKIPESYTISDVRQYNDQPVEELVRKLNEVRLTLIPTQIITMQDWIDGTTYTQAYHKGNFWIVDTDGWCYWANALQGGEATGQLLSSVQGGEQSAGELTYRINVMLNATTFADTDLDKFFETATANGGITSNGMLLMFMTSGNYVMGADDELYLNLGGGLYCEIIKNGDSYADYTVGETMLAGTDSLPGTGNELKIGRTFSLDLGGSMIDGNDYTITGFTLGENGVAYIGVGDGVYIKIVDEEGTQKYTPVLAGDDGKIGTGDDSDTAIQYEKRIFFHIGNGVYVETADEDDTESKDSPAVYYFAGALLDERLEINRFNLENTESVNEEVNSVFALQLKVGDRFNIEYGETGAVSSITGSGNTFVMTELVKGTDDDLYIHLSENYYIAPGASGIFSGGGQLVQPDGSGDLNQGTNNNVTVVPTQGDGTAPNPYKITRRSDMDWLSDRAASRSDGLANQHFLVVQDFDMGTVSFTPIGNENANKMFKGTFDGGGYTIDNLTVTTNSTGYRGLFGYIGSGGTVKNARLTNVNIAVTTNNVGSIAGRSEGAIVDCYAEGIVSGAGEVGGLAGRSHSGTGAKLERCGFRGSVTGTADCVGGLVGLRYGATLRDSYMWGNVTGSNSAGHKTGGVIGSGDEFGTIANLYHAKGSVSGNVAGGAIGEFSMPTLTNIVALSDGVSGTTIGKFVGQSGFSSPTNSYYWSGIVGPASGIGSGTGTVTGIAEKRPTQEWWEETASFSSSVWEWDSENDLPVLK